ncbi:glycosyltransferase family 4 protein [Pseudorhodoplanes sp.]|uniref:glycosyltransferase family 4 protein n=1 Tax=Pseudorhodoplanes sp. TaxID=1934341 RepID=UPI003D1407F1
MNKKDRLRITSRYVDRMIQLLKINRPDVIWLEKEVFPFFPWWVEGHMLPQGVPVISDYDDAIFHRYDMHRFSLVKLLLGRKIDSVMAHSDVVIAGNDYLAERARMAGAPHVEIVPTVVDIDTYLPKLRVTDVGPPKIGWIGTPETWANFGRRMLNLISNIVRDGRASFRAVGVSSAGDKTSGIEFLPWSEENEISLIQDIDIGIMPLPNTPWAQGKCGYKLIQYMACGLPVVASPVGVNSSIVDHGTNGFLADTNEEWTKALETLVRERNMRSRMGVEGRKKVEANYSLQVYGPKVAQILREAAQMTPRKAR